VELVDLRDIYRDFLEDDEDVDRGPVKVTEGPEDEEGFEWVSRRVERREEGLAYHHLPPHVRYGRYGSASMFTTSPSPDAPADVWTAGMSLPNVMDYRHSPWRGGPPYRSPSPATPFFAPALNNPELDNTSEIPLKLPIYDTVTVPSPSQPHSSHPPHVPETTEPSQSAEHPNLQLHLHINWHSNLRITLTTSLLINYPSPMFMSLPIKLSVTGLIFTGELAVAYEGARRRVHLCILDDLDPYGPAAAGDRPKRNPNPNPPGSAGSTPPEMDEESPQASASMGRLAKPLPVGQRLLPSIYIESEIGQADKHVLKNVTRVERFIQDVIRKTIEEELVFPNFHTLVMGEG
jgi:distribution and morphology protein 12